MTAIWQDLRLAFRTYSRKPLFTSIVIAILGLGIGANAVIFSVVNAVLLQPLEYPESDRLVNVFQTHRISGQRGAVSPPNYFDLADDGRAFTELAAYWTPSVTISTMDGNPEHVLAATCTHHVFDVLGVTAAIGRRLEPGDDVAAARRVVVLSDGLWRRRFGGDPAIVGREVMLDGNPTLIVGVMPARFGFPVNGTDLWIPLRLSRTQPPNPAIDPDHYRQYRILNLVGRLKDGVTVAQASSAMTAVAARLEREFPEANLDTTVAVVPLKESIVGPVRPALLILLAAVACVLLIACANVGSLMLVHAAARTHEVAIRMALGASRVRLMRQMFTESLILGLAGGALGLFFSVWGIDLLLRIVPAGVPRLETVHVDRAVVTFVIGVSMASGLLFGIAPAFYTRARRLQRGLLLSGRSMVSGTHQRARHILVVSEVALSLVLLIAAVLLIRSFIGIEAIDTGLRTASVVTLDRLEVPRARASARANAEFFERLLANLRGVSGIESVAATLGLPLDARARFFVDGSPFSIAGQTPLPIGQRPEAPLHVVSNDYFRTMGVPLLRGRAFNEQDSQNAPGVLVINDAMARRFWPNQNPIGQRLTHDLSLVPAQATTREIVGVVGDVRHFGLEQPAEAQMFIPHAQMPWPAMAIVMRTSLKADDLMARVRDAVWTLDRSIPIPPIRPMEQVMSDAVGQPRFRAALLAVFASIAFLLAMIGLYGTMAYAAERRTREIGLRLALGATPEQVTMMLVGDGLKLAVLGVGLGVAASLVGTRVLSSMLFGVGTMDPATFVGVPCALLGVAALACYLPARHARSLDAIRAINREA